MSQAEAAPSHLTKPALPPDTAPGFSPTPESIQYDKDLHLNFEPPAYVKTLPGGGARGGIQVQYPVPITHGADDSPCRPAARELNSGAEVPFNGLAYSAPFRLLSDKGVQALRSVVEDNEQFARALPSRAAKALRGLGYRSQFMKDFSYCPTVLSHFSAIAGTPLGPHHMPHNISQINFGEVGASRMTDTWHIDSVPYVAVVILSDTTDMVGGRLQVALLGDASESIEKVRAGTVDPKDIDSVQYPGAGFCILMQGSRIAHCVTPVEAARERRLSMVCSYQSLNPFSRDRTIYVTFQDVDPPATAKFEYARHVGWRVRGQLKYLMQEAALVDDTDELVRLLSDAAGELNRARDLITGRITDTRPYKPLDGEEEEGEEEEGRVRANKKRGRDECEGEEAGAS